MYPKLFSIGSFFLPTYGVLVAIGFLVGMWVTTRIGKKAGFLADDLVNLAVLCALAGIVGAKVAMFLFDWQIYSANPREFFSISTLRAAGVYQGGLILAIAVAVSYVKSKRLAFLPVADVFAPGVAVGHAIGRLGCLAAGCCWGIICDRGWAVTFRSEEAHELTGVPLNTPLHPTQLYETVTELMLFAFLYWRSRKPYRPGLLIGMYLICSSAIRFVIEFYRNHEQQLQLGLSLTQWIAVGLALMGAGLVSGRLNRAEVKTA